LDLELAEQLTTAVSFHTTGLAGLALICRYIQRKLRCSEKSLIFALLHKLH
jgi:hypothetical protein